MKKKRGRKGSKLTAAKAPPAPPQSRPPTNDGPGLNPPYGDFGYFDVATPVNERCGRSFPSLANIVTSSPNDDEASAGTRGWADRADALILRPFSEVLNSFKLGRIETNLQLLALTKSDYLRGVADEYLLDLAQAGMIDAIVSFFAPCEKKSVDEILPMIYHEGQTVLYSGGGGSSGGTIKQVHYDDELRPYYTIDLRGKERQTDHEHLSLTLKMEELPLIWLIVLAKITFLLADKTSSTDTCLKLKIAEGVKPLIRCLKRDNRREVFKSNNIWCALFRLLPMLLSGLCLQSKVGLDPELLESLFQDKKTILFVIRAVFYRTHRPDITKEIHQWGGKIDDGMVPELLKLLDGYIKKVVCSENRPMLDKDAMNSQLMDIATTRIVYQHFDPDASTFIIGLTYLVKNSANDEVKEVSYNLLQSFVAAKCVDKDVIKAVIDVGRHHVSCYEHACSVSVLTIQLVSSSVKDNPIPVANESYMHYAVKHGLIEMILGLLLEYWNDKGEIEREQDRSNLVNLLTRVIQSGMEIITSDRAAKAIRARSDAITLLNEQLESSISRICSVGKQQTARAQKCLAIVKFIRSVSERPADIDKIHAEFMMTVLPLTGYCGSRASATFMRGIQVLQRHVIFFASLFYFTGVFELVGTWSETLCLVSSGLVASNSCAGMADLVALNLVFCHWVWVFCKHVWSAFSSFAVSLMASARLANFDATSYEVELVSEESTTWPPVNWVICISFVADMIFNGVIARFIMHFICQTFVMAVRVSFMILFPSSSMQ